jgi:molybdate transport system permease protein
LNLHPYLLSLQVTLAATVLIVVFGIALGLLLVRSRMPGRRLIEALVMLPLVLPPTVVGYYLLVFLGRGGPVQEWLGLNVVFTPAAAVLASAVVGLPLMVQASRAAIGGVDPVIENAARTLGSSEVGVFFRVTLPLARRGLLAGTVLGAARALGEFGATLMVAGNIPERTQTLPLFVYDAVQNRDYGVANQVVLVLTLVSLISLWAVRRLGEPVTRSGPR